MCYQSTIGNGNLAMIWVGRRELNPHGPQSQCGALPIELRPTQKGDKESNVTSHFWRCSHIQHSPGSFGRDDETRTRNSTDRKSVRFPFRVHPRELCQKPQRLAKWSNDSVDYLIRSLPLPVLKWQWCAWRDSRLS